MSALSSVVRLGRSTRSSITLLGSFTVLSWWIARRTCELPRHNLRLIGKIFLNQVWFTGIDAAPIIAVLASLIGGVSIIQSFSLLTVLADDLIGKFLVGLIVRELGPLITAVVLIVRSGTAIATEVGSMKINGEIDVLRAHRINPLMFVILPRVYGTIVALFALTALFDIIGILGGFGVACMVADLSFALLRAKVLAALTNADLVLHLIKALLFGTAVGVLPCYFGLRVRESPTELPIAVSKAAVASLVAVFLMDGLLVFFYYLQ
ncbi:MAG: ABC transporter permease [Elusimicrobiota bacterium]